MQIAKAHRQVLLGLAVAIGQLQRASSARRVSCSCSSCRLRAWARRYVRRPRGRGSILGRIAGAKRRGRVSRLRSTALNPRGVRQARGGDCGDRIEGRTDTCSSTAVATPVLCHSRSARTPSRLGRTSWLVISAMCQRPVLRGRSLERDHRSRRCVYWPLGLWAGRLVIHRPAVDRRAVEQLRSTDPTQPRPQRGVACVACPVAWTACDHGLRVVPDLLLPWWDGACVERDPESRSASAGSSSGSALGSVSPSQPSPARSMPSRRNEPAWLPDARYTGAG